MIPDKQAPQDWESELSMVYLVLTSDVAVVQAPALLPAYAFLHPELRAIYEAALNTTRDRADPATVRQSMQDNGGLTEDVSEAFRVLSTFWAGEYSLAWHASRVWRCYQLRCLINFGYDLLRDAYLPGANPDELLGRCSELFVKTDRPGQDDGTFAEAIIEVLAPKDERVSGIRTGLADLDSRMQSLRKGESLVIGARPSIGKTALATQIAAHTALDLGIRTAYFTLEGDKVMLVERIAAQRLEIDYGRTRGKSLSQGDYEKMQGLMNTLGDQWPLKIFKCRRFGLQEFEAIFRRLVALDGCGLAIVDYVQRMRWPEGQREKRLAVEENCRSIVDLGGELNVPVILVSQLNREAEGVEPQMHHLAESGTIEADLDVILLLHRATRVATEATANLVKQRNAPPCKITLTWRPNVVKFSDFSPKDGPPPSARPREPENFEQQVLEPF